MKHIVTFRKLADVRRQAELEQELVARMSALNAEIPFVREWRMSANELDRPICRDYVLESSLDSQADLERYLRHPSHVSLIQALKQASASPKGGRCPFHLGRSESFASLQNRHSLSRAVPGIGSNATAR